MARLRYSLEEAYAEAIRRAVAFMAERWDADSLQLLMAHPTSRLSKSRSSKHPLAWLVSFRPVAFDGVIDGGELYVAVDLEANTVELFGW